MKRFKVKQRLKAFLAAVMILMHLGGMQLLQMVLKHGKPSQEIPVQPRNNSDTI